MIDAAALIGVPFEYGGRSKDAFDCYGLIIRCYEEVHGVKIPDYASPEEQVKIAAIVAGELSKWVEVDGKKAGSVVLFKIKGLATHVGFMISETEFIHTLESTGVGIEPIKLWRRRVIGFYKYLDK